MIHGYCKKPKVNFIYSLWTNTKVYTRKGIVKEQVKLYLHVTDCLTFVTFVHQKHQI